MLPCSPTDLSVAAAVGVAPALMGVLRTLTTSPPSRRSLTAAPEGPWQAAESAGGTEEARAGQSAMSWVMRSRSVATLPGNTSSRARHLGGAGIARVNDARGASARGRGGRWEHCGSAVRHLGTRRGFSRAMFLNGDRECSSRSALHSKSSVGAQNDVDKGRSLEARAPINYKQRGVHARRRRVGSKTGFKHSTSRHRGEACAHP